MDKITVLIVEDEKTTIDIIVNILKDDDRFILKIATDGQKGLEAYNKFHPQIIISDLNMPKKDGIDMIKEIRKKDQNVQVIVLTSHDEVAYLLEAAELKLTRYIIKPLSKNKLFETIDLAISQMQKFQVITNDILQLNEGFSWDINNLELKKNFNLINLTPKEKKILNLFFTNQNNIITYEDLFENVWEQYNEKVNKEALKTLMSSLRKKLPPKLIENVFGIGYKISIK